MDKNYNPKEVEPVIYKMWADSGLFTPKIDPGKKPFVIALPPPNITGDLHFGHLSFLSYSDTLGRYHRMKGDPTLLLPGTDHAAIAAQLTVERLLVKEGLTRQELGKERFMERMWEFINTYRPRIISQIKAVGVSADWTREHFTLDEDMTAAVKQFFIDLKNDNLLYQGDYITTWCPKCQTVLSDLENIHQEEEGNLWYIKYGPITVATTRPETMLGDSAVAVNPADTRYSHLVGTTVTLPLLGRALPIIADGLVDMKFGTGALKVTPAHSESDYEMGQRHNLPVISVIDRYSTITNEGGPYAGLKINQAREKIVNDLSNLGLIEKTERITHAVGHCERSGTVTEQLITKQWFVKMRGLAQPAIEAIKEGKIKVIPEGQTKVLIDWLEHIHDWTISRQLWWGHPIPLEGEVDTLDTWFSSALWPFATLGWPKNSADFNYFFPTNVIFTGRDILFFWIARMIMSSLYETKKIPFETIYLSPFVVDEHGQKMSKTKGNILDPLPLAEKYGMDALRMSLILQVPPNSTVRLGEAKISGTRNFANKIWNSARFVLSFEEAGVTKQNNDDLDFLEKLTLLEASVSALIDSFHLNEAAEKLYDFYWHEFCDKYIETTKIRRQETQETLLISLKRLLVLLHPFMPFITEEIWQKIPLKSGQNEPPRTGLLMEAPWPTVN